MDLRQLNALLAVAEHHSFSAAARALHTVQSNVSTHVARLEQEVGAILIERSRGELTTEGEIVAGRARRIIAELRAIEDDLVALRDDVAGSVRAGVIGTTARWLVPSVLDAVSTTHPRIELQVVEATTTSLVPQLLSDRLDVAVVNLPVDDPDIDVEVLFAEERIVVAPIDHPLAAHERITLSDLVEHEILLPPRGTAFRDEIDTDARQANVRLTARAEVDGKVLLSWEPGVGWARDPFVDVSGETASSPVADVTLRVSAPAALHLALPGRQHDSGLQEGPHPFVGPEDQALLADEGLPVDTVVDVVEALLVLLRQRKAVGAQALELLV